MNTKKVSLPTTKNPPKLCSANKAYHIVAIAHHKIWNAPHNFNATTRHKGDISSNWPVVVDSVVVSVCEKARTKFNVHINIVNDMKHATKLMEFYSEKFSCFFGCLFCHFMSEIGWKQHIMNDAYQSEMFSITRNWITV